MGVNRHKSVVIITVLVFLIGLPSAMRLDILNNQDWVWGIGLMLVGLLISFAIMKRGPEMLRTTLVNTNPKNNLTIPKFWNATVYLFPVLFVVIFGWWLYQGIMWYPGNWWDPFETFSTGTMLFQWAIALILAFSLNGVFNKYTRKTSAVLEEDPTLQTYVTPWDELIKK